MPQRRRDQLSGRRANADDLQHVSSPHVRISYFLIKTQRSRQARDYRDWDYFPPTLLALLNAATLKRGEASLADNVKFGLMRLGAVGKSSRDFLTKPAVGSMGSTEASL